MSKEMCDFEVTEVLKQKGIRKIEKQRETIAITLSDNNKIIRSTIYKADFDKSIRALKKACFPYINDKLIIEEIVMIISLKWNELIGDDNDSNEYSLRDVNTNSIFDEIKKDKAANGDVSPETWRTTLIEKYTNLMKVIQENLPQLKLQIELQLSVKSILNIKDCTLPLAVIVLGAPSSLKTQGIELFRKWPYTYYTDNFSARSFVSHNTSVNREQLKEIDLLPKIKNKIFLTPELAPTFASKDDDLVQLLGIITRVVDGHGYFSNSGAHGGRGYEGPMMFVWIGAAVDIPKRVHKCLSTLGPKLYFLRLPKEVYPNPEKEYLKQIKGTDFGTKVSAIHDALFDYLKWVELCPFAVLEQSSSLPKITWNSENKDDELSITYIIRLGILLSHLRGSVPTWDTSHSQGSEYAYGIATIEEPSRAITQLMNLAKGRAISQGRNFITKEDVSIVIKVVLSTASIERVAVFDLLLAHGGKLQTPVIEESLNVTSPTALRTMTEFKAIGLVDSNKNNGSSHVNEINLKPEFNWFLTPEFRKLRDGYKPEKYSETEQDDSRDGRGSTNSNVNCEISGKSTYVSSQEDKHTSGIGNAINSNLSPVSKIYDIPRGDTTTTYTGRVIVRCYKGSDWWRCTAEKCRMKGDIYAMRSHTC
jgi:hypothetical protein